MLPCAEINVGTRKMLAHKLARSTSIAARNASIRAASTISVDASGALKVPNDPIIPFIEGDGTGPG